MRNVEHIINRWTENVTSVSKSWRFHSIDVFRPRVRPGKTRNLIEGHDHDLSALSDTTSTIRIDHCLCYL